MLEVFVEDPLNVVQDAANGEIGLDTAIDLGLTVCKPCKVADKVEEQVDRFDDKPFALGIDDHLDDFARRYDADTWKQFDDVENWQPQVLDKILDPNQKVLFNLDGVDVWDGLSRSSAGRGGTTDWELLRVRENPQAWDTIDFIKDGVKVENPFK